MSIFVINTDTYENVGNIDFVPAVGDYIILGNRDAEKEYQVSDILYYPSNHGILVFAEEVYNLMKHDLSKINWKKNAD